MQACGFSPTHPFPQRGYVRDMVLPVVRINLKASFKRLYPAFGMIELPSEVFWLHGTEKYDPPLMEPFK
jgi:hypothetical protein